MQNPPQFIIHHSSFIIRPRPWPAWNVSLESKTQMDNELFPIPDYCLIKPILPAGGGNGRGNGREFIGPSPGFQQVFRLVRERQRDRRISPRQPRSLSLAFKDKGPVEWIGIA